MSRQVNLTSGLRAPRLFTPLSNMAVINDSNPQATFYKSDFENVDEEAMIRQFSGHGYTGPPSIKEIFRLKPSRTEPVPQEMHLQNIDISRLAQHGLSEPLKIVSPIPLRGTAKCLSPEFFEANDHYSFNSPRLTPQPHVADPFDSWHGSFAYKEPAVNSEDVIQARENESATPTPATVKSESFFDLLMRRHPVYGQIHQFLRNRKKNVSPTVSSLKSETPFHHPETNNPDSEAFALQEKRHEQFKSWESAFGPHAKRKEIVLDEDDSFIPTLAVDETECAPQSVESEVVTSGESDVDKELLARLQTLTSENVVIKLGSGLEALAALLMNNKTGNLLENPSLTNSPLTIQSPATPPSRRSLPTPEILVAGRPTKSSKPKKPFKPNNMLLRNRGVIPMVDNTAANTRYQGNLNSRSFTRTQFDLQASENCSLFVSGVPPATTLAQLFSLIHVGSVWALSFLDSDPKFRFKAFKLVFFNPESSAAFKKLADSPGIFVNGHRLRVTYNREGQTKRKETETRVLNIEGPEDKMNHQFWAARFTEACVWQIESYRFLDLDEKMKLKGIKRMEYRFSRVDGQAQTCRIKIKDDPKLKHMFKVEYGIDPCGVSTSS